MPSKDTVLHHITIETSKEIEHLRKIIAKELGVSLKDITKKQAEIALRLKSKRGYLFKKELIDILTKKIK